MTPGRSIAGGFATTPGGRRHPPLALLAGLLAMALGLPAIIVSAGEGPTSGATANVPGSTTHIQPIVAMDWFAAGPAGHRDSVVLP